MYDNATCSCGRNAYYEQMTPMGCNKSDTGCLSNIPYAMAVVRPQHNPRMFNPAEALCKGTMFPDLFRPYHY